MLLFTQRLVGLAAENSLSMRLPMVVYIVIVGAVFALFWQLGKNTI